MKASISSTFYALCVLASIGIYSFTLGGEGFEIMIANRTVLEKYGNQLNDVNTIQLSPGSIDQQMSIKYHHCGRVGKSRVVTIKNMQDQLVKEWRFADVSSAASAMNFNLKEIFGLKEPANKNFKLYYSSSELPAGRMLANLVLKTK